MNYKDRPALELMSRCTLMATLFGFIQNGIPDTAMPAWGNKLTDEEIWHIVNYLRIFEEATQ